MNLTTHIRPHSSLARLCLLACFVCCFGAAARGQAPPNPPGEMKPPSMKPPTMKPPTMRGEDSDADTARSSSVGWTENRYRSSGALLGGVTPMRPTYVSEESLTEYRCRNLINNAEKSLKLNPNDYEAIYKSGLCYARLNQHKEAEEAFKKALKILEGKGAYTGFKKDVLYNLGNVYADAGRYDEAIDAYQRALNENSGAKKYIKDIHYNMGIVYGKQWQYPKAAEAFREAVKLDPKFIRARYNLGLVYLKLGNRSGAEEQYKILKAAGSKNDAKAAELAKKLGYSILSDIDTSSSGSAE